MNVVNSLAFFAAVLLVPGAALAAGLPTAATPTAATPTAAKAPTAQESVDAGLNALTRGDNSAAVGAFRLAVQADPDDRAARRLLADALRRIDRCPDALAQYQLLQSAGSDDDARRGEVACLRALGQHATAARLAAEVAARHPVVAGRADPLAEWAAAEVAAAGAGAPAAPVNGSAPADAGPDAVEELDAQGEAQFAAGRFADAAAWFAMADATAPTAQRAWRLAMAKLGAGELLPALRAVEATLQRNPQQPGAEQTRKLLAEMVRTRGSSGNAVPMVPTGRSIRITVLQALADGDEVLARQLLPLWRSGPERGIVAELVQAELWLRDNRLSDADRLLRWILAKQPNHPGALKALAEVVILRGEFQQARGMLGLSPVRPANGEDPNADLYRFMLRRRGEWQQQIRMAVDPGVKPLPALSSQLADMVPPPPPEEVARQTPIPIEPAEKPRRESKNRKAKAPELSPSPSKTLMTKPHKPARKTKPVK